MSTSMRRPPDVNDGTALGRRPFENPLRHTSIRTLSGPHLRPGAYWGPNRHGCCHLDSELFRLELTIAVTRTGRFVVSRSVAYLSHSTF